MRLLGVLGASEALGDHLVRHPAHWRELTDPSLGSTRPAAYAVRCGPAPCGRRGPRGPDPDRHPARRRGGRRAAGGVPPRAAAPGRARPRPPPRRRRRRRRARRPRCRHPRRRPGGGPAAGRRAGGDGPAGRRRDGQVRRARAQLRLRRRRDLRGRAAVPTAPDEAAALRTATQLAAHLVRICGDHTAEGTIWPVDAALRPEGKSGPLVRTLASHRGYYERWAKTWEFQALLKARAVAGDLELGAGVRRTWSHPWSGAPRSATASSATSRRCVAGCSTTSPRARPSGSSSSGPAGCATWSSPCSCSSSCTDAPTSRCAQTATLSALAELTSGGYVGREDGDAMHDAYAYLRTARAPDPALPAPAHPRGARRRGRPAPAGPVDGLRSRTRSSR